MLAYGTRRSEGVHDPIFHRIVALDDGDTRFVLISTDVAGISPAFHDQVVAELMKPGKVTAAVRFESGTHDHVGAVGASTLNQCPGLRRGVRVVAVSHDVQIRINGVEHVSNHAALALAG